MLSGDTSSDNDLQWERESGLDAKCFFPTGISIAAFWTPLIGRLSLRHQLFINTHMGSAHAYSVLHDQESHHGVASNQTRIDFFSICFHLVRVSH
jgi:hypothetical protein